jgi:antirestriction protein
MDTQIYIACLASYNAGRLHGAWFDVTRHDDAEDIEDAIQDVLTSSPVAGAEEYAIHDYENFPAEHFGECPDLEELCAYARLVEEDGDDARARLLVSNFGAAWRDHTEDYYQRHRNKGDAAYELYNDEVPENLARYIDWRQMEEDMCRDGWWQERGNDGLLYTFADC